MSLVMPLMKTRKDLDRFIGIEMATANICCKVMKCHILLNSVIINVYIYIYMKSLSLCVFVPAL